MMKNPNHNALQKEITLSKAQYAIWSSTHQVNLFMGGQGSGKTALMAILAARFIQQFPQMLGLIAANTYLQLTISTMKRILSTWATYCDLHEYSERTGVGDYVIGKQPPEHFERHHKFPKYDHIISFSWGACVVIGSLDNYKAFDGSEFGWELLDETKDTREEAIDDVLVGRLRQAGMYIQAGEITDAPIDEQGNANEPFLPLYIFTSPAKVPWLNEKFALGLYEEEIRGTIYYPEKKPYFFKKETKPNHFVAISATHLNRKNLPANYIDLQSARISSDKQGMLIFGDPFAKTGGEFIKHFDGMKHVADVADTYDPELPLHLSFDFNSVPYITCLAYQVRGKAVTQIKEFCLPAPQNSTPALCDVLNKHFAGQVAKVYIYGDPSGNSKNKNTTTREKKGDFDVIKTSLNFKLVDKVKSTAPSVSVSRDFLDLILEKEQGGISLVIDKNCTKTLDDFKYTKEGASGEMEKKTVRDTKTGVVYQPYGHPMDTKRYFFVQCFEDDYRTYTGRRKTKVETLERETNPNSY